MSASGQVPRRVWSGTTLLVLGRLWGSACTLVTLYLLAHHLSDEGFGRLTFYLSLFLVLDSFVDLGTGQLSVQRTAADPEAVSGILRRARFVRLGAGLIGCALVGGGAFLTEEPGAGWILLATLYPLTHALELSTLVFKNQIAWGRPVLVRASASTLSLLCVLLFWSQGVGEPALYLVAVALGSTCGNIGLHLSARGHLPLAQGAPAPLLPFLAAAIPMGAAGLCQQLYFYIDNLFVRPLAGDAALGHYQRGSARDELRHHDRGVRALGRSALADPRTQAGPAGLRHRAPVPTLDRPSRFGRRPGLAALRDGSWISSAPSSARPRKPCTGSWRPVLWSIWAPP